MKEKMTVHEALRELKTLNARIYDGINSLNVVVANKHNNGKIGGKPIQDFVQATKDSYKSVRTLMNRRDAIKRAVTKSNASTEVELDGKTYTIAEAIEMKNHGIEFMTMIRDRISSQLESARRAADRENAALEDKADAYITTMYQSVNKKNFSEAQKKDREDFITAHTVELVDPLDAAQVVKTMNEHISVFMTKVDSALSVSNALTMIEFEYETL